MLRYSNRADLEDDLVAGRAGLAWWIVARRSGLGAAGLAIVACAPIVAHGPHVEPGLSGGITASVRFGSPFLVECHQGSVGHAGSPPTAVRDCPDVPRLAPGPAFASIGYGWRPENSGRPVSITLQLPGPLGVHVEMPTTDDDWRRAVGLLLSPFQASPYVQFGPAGGSWYSTQLLWAANPLDWEEDYVSPGLHWVPSVSWTRASGEPTGSLTIHLLGNLGLEVERHRPDDRRPLLPVWGITTGATVHIGR